MTKAAAVIGDIHGEVELLAALIEVIRARCGPKVDLYHVGDMIDRGPDPKGVVQLCIDNGIRGVLGNHETWLHQYLATGVFDTFALSKALSGEATLRSYGLDSTSPDEITNKLRALVPASHRDYILSLPLWRKVSMPGTSYRLTHTGVKSADVIANLGAAERNVGKFRGSLSDAICAQIAAASPTQMLWTRPNFHQPDLYWFPDGSCQIFGHSPVREPILHKAWIALDTGSGTRPPFTLSAVLLPSREIVSVNALTVKTRPGSFTDFTM